MRARPVADGLRWLLDTDTLSELIRNPRGVVVEHLARVSPDSMCTSIVVACELRYGAWRRGSAALTERVEALLGAMPVLPFDQPSDHHYADIRATLEAAGTPIGGNDLLIAAQARSRGLVVVTHNTREFARVPGLEVEDWLRPLPVPASSRPSTGRKATRRHR